MPSGRSMSASTRKWKVAATLVDRVLELGEED